MRNIQQFLKKWLVERAASQGISGPIDLDTDFIQQGIVDSMGIMEMVLELENQFEFRFTETDFQLREFCTIEGLSKIITRRINSD